jgi:hypothetical protein
MYACAPQTERVEEVVGLLITKGVDVKAKDKVPFSLSS